MLSSDVQCFVPSEGKTWFFLDNVSGFFSSDTTFNLQLTVSYNGQDLAENEIVGKCVIEGQETELKVEHEWEDSDGSDYSLDDLFDGDEAEHEVKLKWKVKREAKMYDKEGNEFAKVLVKVKGKTKAEAKYEPNEEGEMKRVEHSVKVETKVKKVFYTFEFPELQAEPLEIEVDNGHWNDWDRVFETSLFRAEYVAKWGTDVVDVEIKDGAPTIKALLCGYSIAYYFHPARYVAQMSTRARHLV
jgi:hypothetical protein